VYAPNVFSQNAYWPDNYFWLSTDGAVVNIKRFIVADRWGEILYEATNVQPNNPESGWDGYFRGKAMMPDTYLFFAELERYDGTVFQNQGGFSLVR
jgi:gliding motility-associated-like protein